MTPIRRAFARALACALLLAAGPALAQTLSSGKVNTGTPTFVNDQNVPLQLDATGALKVTGGTGGGGGGNAATTSNATDGQATTTTNQANVTYNYLYNGTTWDRMRGTGGAANVAITGSLPAFASTPTFNVGTTGGLALDATLTARLGTLGQKTSANSAPVVLPSDQTVPISAATLPLPTGAATAAKQPALGTAGTPSADVLTVQGAPNGTPQNTFPCQYNSTLPSWPTGQSGYASCDINGRILLGAGTQLIGFVSLSPSTSSAAGIAPVTTTGSSVVAKASGANLFGYHATFGATAGYVATLNVTAAPSAGAAIAPVECTPVAANASFRTRQDIPDRYATGLVLVATSSCTTFTAVTPQVMGAVAN